MRPASAALAVTASRVPGPPIPPTTSASSNRERASARDTIGRLRVGETRIIGIRHVLEHRHAVTHADPQGSSGTAFSDHDANHRYREPRHLEHRVGDHLRMIDDGAARQDRCTGHIGGIEGGEPVIGRLAGESPVLSIHEM